ncbi:MAG: glycosyltransferase, partial [Gammaproteobacteria bacterium]|nr:glycosyltransferase [Gammaproteobacteria bacterium]
MQVFVLGMHRSGTSAVARVLNLMGCYFGAEHEGTRANEENPKGFWERQDVRRLNDVMLRSVGCDWDRVSGFDAESMLHEQSVYRRAMADIVLDMDAHRPWFVKEPRLCLLFPLWRPLLETPVCIHVHRSPMEVARSLHARHGIPHKVGLALWEVYNIQALAASKGLPRRLVSYRELMRAPEEVVGDLGRSLSNLGYALRSPAQAELRAFLDESLHRQRDDGDAWDATATPSQKQLLNVLAHAEANGMDSLPDLPSISDEALAVLREYEAGAETVESRRRRANAVEQRHRENATDMQLALKQAELETTLKDLRRVSQERNRHQSEVRRLHDDLARVQRERGIATGEVRRLEEFNRHLSHDVSTMRERLRQTERDTQTLRDRLDARERRSQREIRRLRDSEAQLRVVRRQLLGRVDAQDRLLEGFAAGTNLLLSSWRWRLGHALLSLRHRLLLRKVPNTVADHLREQAAEYQELQHAPLPRAVPDPAKPPGTPDRAMPQPKAAPIPRLRREVTVAVIAWDVGHNPLGRAYLVAEALARSYTVVLLGFQFPRYGDAVWKPLRHAPFRTVVIPGASFPEFQQTLERLAPRIDADVVVACKARLPSVQLGLMLKALRNRPLLVDVDDYELSFFRNRDPLGDVAGLDAEVLTHPFEEAWTRYVENLLPHADRLLVSNPALAAKFGGATVPHARDERKFDPGRHNAAEVRRELGLQETDKVVMFVGTPRPHKGVLEILDAVRSLGRADYRFVIVGTPPEESFAKELSARGGDALRLVPDQPFGKLPALMATADLVCLLQDPNSEISRFQLPAKVVDAMAMGVPVLATAVPPLAPLTEEELIEPVSATNLAERIGHWLEAPAEERGRRTRRARERFLAEFSYDAIHRTLFAEVEACLNEPRALPAEAHNFLGAQQRRYSLPVPATGDGLDIVVFWKQGDIGLYGRRVDMVIEHLARRSEVRRIAVFDAPFSVRQMWRRVDAEDFDHHEEVTRSKLVRRWGLADGAKVSHHVFLFDSGSSAETIDGVAGRTSAGGYPGEAAFADFVAAELDLAGIDPRAAIFWHYPVLAPISALNGRFQPRLSVVDVVDDLRTWPDRTEADREEYTEHYRT